jgi:hypothetical protein
MYNALKVPLFTGGSTAFLDFRRLLLSTIDRSVALLTHQASQTCCDAIQLLMHSFRRYTVDARGEWSQTGSPQCKLDYDTLALCFAPHAFQQLLVFLFFRKNTIAAARRSMPPILSSRALWTTTLLANPPWSDVDLDLSTERLLGFVVERFRVDELEM